MSNERCAATQRDGLDSLSLIAVPVSVGEQFGLWLPSPALLLQQSGSAFYSLAPIALMIGIFYLLVIMPARKRQKRLQEMLANLVSGDRVVTNGGLRGTVVGLSEARVTLRIPPDGIKLEFARNAIVGMAEKPGD